MTGEHTQRVAQKRQIPWTTLVRKARKTAVGIGFVALGLSIAKWLIPPLNQWCVYVCLIYGGFSVAGDIMRGLHEWLPAALRDLATGIRDLVAAVKGK